MFATRVVRLASLLTPTSKPLPALSDSCWRDKLISHGFGKPVLYRSETWSAHAEHMHAHSATCGICRAALRKAVQAGGGRGQRAYDTVLTHLTDSNNIDTHVLTREEARATEDNDDLLVHPSISWDGTPHAADKFTHAGEHGEAALVSLCAAESSVERARLSPRLAAQLLELGHAEVDAFSSALRNTTKTAHTDAFWLRVDMRLDQHIVLSSLLATDRPASSLAMDVHDYGFYRAIPRRRAPGPKELLVKNENGLTVLDLMRHMTDWPKEEGNGLFDRELLPFKGIEWAPYEYVERKDGNHLDVELIAAYGDPFMPVECLS